MFMKDKIIKVLQAHPKGLKAKEIASYIPNTDRKMINQVLYTNKDCFQISADYIWTLKVSKTNITQTDKTRKTKSPFQYLSERDRELIHRRWEEEKARQERLQRAKIQWEKEAATRRSNGDGFTLFRKCTGDCSTCTREECIEK